MGGSVSTNRAPKVSKLFTDQKKVIVPYVQTTWNTDVKPFDKNKFAEQDFESWNWYLNFSTYRNLWDFPHPNEKEKRFKFLNFSYQPCVTIHGMMLSKIPSSWFLETAKLYEK